MIDRSAIEQEIILWSDLYEWHSDDRSMQMEKLLLDDAIKQAEKHLTTDIELGYAVIMALIVEQQKLIAYWGKEMLKK